MSLTDTLSGLSQFDRLKLRAQLASCSTDTLAALEWRARWKRTARHAQWSPKDDWFVWLILAGRGWGKTLTGANQLGWWAWTEPRTFNHVVASTNSDLKKVIFEGPTGFLRVLPPEIIADYNKSYYELTLVNGSIIRGFSAEEPDRLRGPQCHKAWCDELAAWGYPETFDQLNFGLRLGEDPRVIVTTTPRPTPIIKELVSRKFGVYVTKGSTFENEENLPQSFLQHLKDKYQGSRLGRQELEAEILDDTKGALWTYALLDSCRTNSVDLSTGFKEIVVAVDPATTAHEESDETGIIVAGRTNDDQGVVIADKTMSMALPSEWGAKAISLYHEYGASRIVVEVNNGGDLITDLFRRMDSSVVVRSVRASVGKYARAEPISVLYEQGKIKHLGVHAALESQLCTFVPGVAKKSPDRLDALVWALTSLFPPFTEIPVVCPVMIHK